MLLWQHECAEEVAMCVFFPMYAGGFLYCYHFGVLYELKDLQVSKVHSEAAGLANYRAGREFLQQLDRLYVCTKLSYRAKELSLFKFLLVLSTPDHSPTPR